MQRSTCEELGPLQLHTETLHDPHLDGSACISTDGQTAFELARCPDRCSAANDRHTAISEPRSHVHSVRAVLGDLTSGHCRSYNVPLDTWLAMDVMCAQLPGATVDVHECIGSWFTQAAASNRFHVCCVFATQFKAPQPCSSSQCIRDANQTCVYTVILLKFAILDQDQSTLVWELLPLSTVSSAPYAKALDGPHIAHPLCTNQHPKTALCRERDALMWIGGLMSSRGDRTRLVLHSFTLAIVPTAAAAATSRAYNELTAVRFTCQPLITDGRNLDDMVAGFAADTQCLRHAVFYDVQRLIVVRVTPVILPAAGLSVHNTIFYIDQVHSKLLGRSEHPPVDWAARSGAVPQTSNALVMACSVICSTPPALEHTGIGDPCGIPVAIDSRSIAHCTVSSQYLLCVQLQAESCSCDVRVPQPLPLMQVIAIKVTHSALQPGNIAMCVQQRVVYSKYTEHSTVVKSFMYSSTLSELFCAIHMPWKCEVDPVACEFSDDGDSAFLGYQRMPSL